jgi:hypothetical protein
MAMQVSDFFEGKTWLIYGKLSISKPEATDAIVTRGGRLVTSVSKKLQYLVWDGDTLGPGDTVTSVKAHDALAIGAVVVGEADFKALLAGTVSARLAAVSAPPVTEAAPAAAPAATAATKAPAKAAKKPVDASLTPEALLARTIDAFTASGWYARGKISSSALHREVAAAVEGVAAMCVDAGRGDLAKTLIHALAPEMGAYRVRLAQAGLEDLDGAIDATLEGLRLAHRGNGDHTVHGWAAARAYALSTSRPASPRAHELEADAWAVVDGYFAGERRVDDLCYVLDALADAGKTWEARRILTRCRRHAPERFADVLRWHPNLLLLNTDNVAWTLALVESVSISERYQVVTPALLARCVAEGWSVDALDVLMNMVAHQRWALYEALSAAGRIDDARRILRAGLAACSSIDRAQWALAIGDEAEAQAALAEESTHLETTLARVERGLEDYEKAWRRLSKRAPDTSVMASVHTLMRFVRFALDHGYARDRYAPLVDEITALFAGDFRTQYDRGVELSHRIEWARVQASVRAAEGVAGAQLAGAEALLASFKELSVYGKDAYARNELPQAVAEWAIREGAPELALKAAMKITKAYQPSHATRVAKAFLPAQPAKALAVFERLADDAASQFLLQESHASLSMRVDGAARTGFLASLWAAVLAA